MSIILAFSLPGIILFPFNSNIQLALDVQILDVYPVLIWTSLIIAV